MSKSGFYRKYNKAIRDTVPGGNELLDTMELFHKISDRHPESTEAGQISRLAETHLKSIRDAMVDYLNH